MGVRTELYGPASSEDSVKVGLELRDVSRNLSYVESYMRQLAESVAGKIWEGKDVPASDKRIELSRHKGPSLSLLETILDKKMARRLYKIEPSMAIGLLRYESGEYLNYRTGRFESPDEGVRDRLARARANYETSLRNLGREIESMEARGEFVESKDIETAIKMSLSEWASLAKASELYRHF